MNIGNCDCNNYSELTANTGIATISTANSSLTGVGATLVLSAGGANGTIIKSIIIKATGPVTTGMVRFFISDGTTVALFREIPIPVYPALTATPTPAPIYPMIEIDLVDVLKLNTGYRLYASTQTANTFNIIAEGLDWGYPQDLPPTCCNFEQNAAVTGLGVVSAANTHLDGTGTIVQVFAAPALTTIRGSIIKSITISALQSTSINGMIRFYIGPDTSHYALLMEVVIPETIQSGFTPSFKVLLKDNFHLQNGYVIGATTQNADSFAITIEAEDWEYPI